LNVWLDENYYPCHHHHQLSSETEFTITSATTIITFTITVIPKYHHLQALWPKPPSSLSPITTIVSKHQHHPNVPLSSQITIIIPMYNPPP
jgi:hypothetical protein